MKITTCTMAHVCTPRLMELTESCLRSLQGRGYKISLLDNGSTVDISHFKKLVDEFIRVDHNIGYTRGSNLLTSIVDTEYTAVISNDVRLVSGGFDEMCEPDAVTFPNVTWKNPKYQHEYIHAGCYVYPTKLHGCFYTGYRTYGSDTEWFLKASKEGYDLKYVPSVEVFHDNKATVDVLPGTVDHYLEDEVIFKERMGLQFNEVVFKNRKGELIQHD